MKAAESMFRHPLFFSSHLNVMGVICFGAQDLVSVELRRIVVSKTIPARLSQSVV